MFLCAFRRTINRLILLVSILTLHESLSAQNIFPDTIRSCKVDSLMLDAGFGYENYDWSTGDTTQFIWVSISGQYTVEVMKDDLFTLDSVFVVITDIYIQDLTGPLLCGDTIYLYPSSGGYDYTWYDSASFNNSNLPPLNEPGDSAAVYPRDTIYFYAKIQDTILNFNYCYDSVRVDVNSIIIADSLIQFKMDCPDSAYARVQAYISGGFPPYHYFWSEGQPYNSDSSKVMGLKDGKIYLTVTDTIGCSLKQSFEVKAYPLPEIELASDPADTVYLQKPFVNFTYQNISLDSLMVDTFYLSSFWWDFLGDSTFTYDVEAPDYIYSIPGTYEVYFHYQTFLGCQDTNNVHIQIVVEPVKLKATTVITPNDDEYNRYFEIFEDNENSGGNNTGGDLKSIASGNAPIDLSKYFLSNTLVIFNRHGQKVYEADNYNNDWEGDNLNDGVYFYILQCKGYYEDKSYTGSFMILTSSP